MDALKLKHVGDVYFVQFEENLDVKTIKTEDEPESELTAAMDTVALAAMQLFDLPETPVKLQEIVWKDGDKAGTKCVLLSGESMFGQFKVALPKVSTQDAETPEEGVYDPGNFKNQYNQAADALREQVKRFLEGARKQRPLPFPAPETPNKKRKGILGSVADKAAGLFGKE
jgi:hypothetical protein